MDVLPSAKCPHKTEGKPKQQEVAKSEQPKDKPTPDAKQEEKPKQRDISNPPVEHVKEIDERDKGTPDDWVPRHRKLIRLTGRHPLNAEPELSFLMSDMLTPSSLHYVRNHGAVPKLEWNSHKISVSGLVKSPKEFNMDEIAALESITIPVTVTCDGNRRKELNMIKHSRAFHWGPSATGTAVWKGVRLSDILTMCDVEKKETYHVCFEGADKLAKDHYGTSIPLTVAMDRTHDVILAYEMNGERLTPDHGFPVRVIIPGFVGGRMVKWLTKITVKEKESDNFYHYHDNRVLPPQVDFDTADSQGWWFKPEYVLYEININSVIAYPQHEEAISFHNATDTYPVRGYAYSGGGRRITRVELSLDYGKTWELCELEFLKDSERHGRRVWTWCHWKLDLPVWKFLHSKEMVVRAWDSANNTQPSDPTWNLLGMLNNSWYRLRINIDSESTRDNPSISFQHPVRPGTMYGGWMPQNGEPRVSGGPHRARKNGITFDELKKHNTEKDCWVAIDGEVLDLTAYLQDHPGGVAPILIHGGQDASEEYHCIHASDADEIKNWFTIGVLTDQRGPVLPKETVLNPRKWISIKLSKKKSISPDTIRFQFELPDKGILGLPVGQHVLLGADINEHFIVRPYTPVSPVGENEENGTIEFVIKIYRKGVNKMFPQGGIMSQFLESLNEGDSIQMKGPAGHILYYGNGVFNIDGKSIEVNQIAMVAGGTGITPMYQLIKAIIKNPKDKTEMMLLYSNHTNEDTLLKPELDKLAEKSNGKLKLWYTVSRPPKEGWAYSTGRLNEHMMSSYLFPPSDQSLVLVCGPPAMVEKGAFPNLERLGYGPDNSFEF